MKPEQQKFRGGLPSETKKDLSVWTMRGTHGHLWQSGGEQARHLSSQQTHQFECRSIRPRHSQAPCA